MYQLTGKKKKKKLEMPAPDLSFIHRLFWKSCKLHFLFQFVFVFVFSFG